MIDVDQDGCVQECIKRLRITGNGCARRACHIVLHLSKPLTLADLDDRCRVSSISPSTTPGLPHPNLARTWAISSGPPSQMDAAVLSPLPFVPQQQVPHCHQGHPLDFQPDCHGQAMPQTHLTSAGTSAAQQPPALPHLRQPQDMVYAHPKEASQPSSLTRLTPTLRVSPPLVASMQPQIREHTHAQQMPAVAWHGGGSNSEYAHINALLHQVHAERVMSGARERWQPDDEEEDEEDL